MTFRTLTERLERLHQLADIVCTKQQVYTLADVILELETYDPNAKVAPELLNALRNRLLSQAEQEAQPQSRRTGLPA